MPHIFISYSSKDRSLIDELAADIELLLDDCTIWFDRELNRSGGHQWWNLICEEIRRCDIFINALSPQVLKSEPCRREYAYARALNKPILPVMIADVEIRYLPVELQAAQIVNFRQRTRDQQRSLKLSLRNMPPAPPLPSDAVQLAPDAPLDPVGVLFDRITRLTVDPDQQRLLILDIQDLFEEEPFQKLVPDLLIRLLERDDVLTGRNIRRAEELRVRVLEQSFTPYVPNPTPTPRIEFPSAPKPPRSEPAPGTRMTDDKGVEMVYVPAGKFLMGSTQTQIDEMFARRKEIDKGAKHEWYEDQLPQHEVQILQPFWLDLTPVTNATYARFIQDGGYRNKDYWTKAGWDWLQNLNKISPKYFDGFTDLLQPRVGVSWYEAHAYSHWRSGRLPTEAEWEWAARGPENHIYPWGDTFDSRRLIFNENSSGKTAVVSSDIRLSGASWIGALDMCGNVWEWTSSLYQPYRYQFDDGREDQRHTGMRILRGGSWSNFQFDARSTFRYNLDPYFRDSDIGFRIVRPITERL